MELLKALRDKKSKGMEVHLGINDISYDFVDLIESLCTENKG